jgi:hypothetical protein
MEKYSKAVSEMYSQFNQKEAHPLEKYIGRLARCTWGGISEVVGYSVDTLGGEYLIVGAFLPGGWNNLSVGDVVFKECESYLYVRVNDLID